VTDLAKLVVKLEAQTADYMRKLDAAEKKLGRFSKQSGVTAASIGKGLAGAAVAAAGSFAFLARGTVDALDQFDDMRQRTGVAADVLSELAYAAKLSGSSIEGLQRGLTLLSRNLSAAAEGLKEPSEAFGALGVAVTDARGVLRPVDDVLGDLADRFAAMEDGTTKTALALRIFGKSGAELIPFLNNGRDGLAAFRAEAAALGLTVSNETAMAASQLRDNMDRLKAAGQGVANQLVTEMLPTFIALTDRFIASAKNSGALEVAVKTLGIAFRGLVSAGVIVSSVFEQVGRLVYGVAMAVFNVARGEFRLAAEELGDAFSSVQSNVAQDLETLAAVWDDQVPAVAATAAKMDAALEDSIVFSPTKAKGKARDAAAEALSELEKLAAGLEQQVATYGMADSAALAYRATQGDLAQTFRDAGAAGAPYLQRLIELTTQLEEIGAKSEAARERAAEWQAVLDEGARVTESVRTAAEVYADELDRLQQLLELGAISQDTYNRAAAGAKEAFEKASEGAGAFADQAMRNAQDALADFLTDLSKGKDVLENFGQALLRIAANDLAQQLFGLLGAGSGGGGGLFGGIASKVGGFLGGVFGGTMDNGGRGYPGKAYLIGTGAQPEMFVPDRPGEFVPAGAAGGMSVVQNFSIVAPAGTVTRQTEQQLAAAAARGLAQAGRRGN
jgi:hypothetical protein